MIGSKYNDPIFINIFKKAGPDLVGWSLDHGSVVKTFDGIKFLEKVILT